MTEFHWTLPPNGSVDLKENIVHLWRCRINEAASEERQLFGLLSPDERERAKGFRIEASRRQFIVARGVLRDVLRRYLELPPRDLRFAYTAYGKPYVDKQDQPQIAFNLAHSENICLIAVALRDRLGIDVECVGSGIDYEAVARETFSSVEIARLRAVDPQLRPQTFFESWTRKEAYLKAIGEGLSADLMKAIFETARWTILNFAPDPGYIAAAAIEACDIHFDAWHWEMGRSEG